MACNSTIPGLRLVRCPRCRVVLTEIASVPVYQCGECGVTLRAKHYSSTNQSVASLASQSSKAADASSSGLNQGDEVEHEEGGPKERQMELKASSSDARSMDFRSSSPNIRNDASPDDKENNNKNHHSERGNVSEIASANAFDVGISSVVDTGNVETPRKRVPLSRRTFRGMVQELESSTEKPAALDTFGSHANEVSQKETDDLVMNPSFVSKTASSNALDASISSVIDTGNVETPRKIVPLSRRTFRRIVQDSADTKEHKEEGVKEMQVGTQIVAQEVSQESSIEKPAALDTFGSHANSSFDSDDFHSVQNQMESENHVHSRSVSINIVEVSKGSADKQNDLDSFEISGDSEVPMGLLNIQMEILRKVDGLKEEINGIFDKSDESKAQPHHVKHLKLGRRQTPPKVPHQRKAIPRPPRGQFDIPRKHCHYEGRQASPSHCYNGICRACHHNHPSHNPQVEHQTKKPNNDGRQQKKQHCRPVLGGSPFVVCHNCFELLRLPMNFFIECRRFYKLQCGACSKVLTFSFRTPKYGIPHTFSEEAETPTTELDSSTDTIPRHEVSNFPSNDRSPWEPVSYSDHGYSLASDTEMPVNVPSRSTLMDKRKSRLRTGSQLYQLMDYGSASEILYRHSDIDEVSEFTAPSTPRCNTPEERLVEDGMIRKCSYVSDPSTSHHF